MPVAPIVPHDEDSGDLTLTLGLPAPRDLTYRKKKSEAAENRYIYHILNI